MIPVNQPLIAKNALKYVSDCIKTGWISSAGSYISKFEKEFAAYIGVKHAITVTSGTAALHVGLAALSIGKGDEVIIPDNTMIACAFAVLYTGATPVFVDAERDTWNMDISQIEKKITKKTKAIMPAHIYGLPCDMDPIIKLAKKYKLFIIEDAAEAHGAEYKGKKVGSIGTIGCFSFYGNKIITTGEGGMVVTNDDRLAENLRSLKDLSHAKKKRFLHETIGFNYRMTNMQAALGLAQLEQVDKFIRKKLWMAKHYYELLSGTEGLTLPAQRPWAKNVFWMYGILVEDEFGISRDVLQKKLYEEGIDTRTFFYPIHKQPALQQRKHSKDHYPVSDDISERGLYLPSGLAITEEQIKTVCQAVNALKQ